ncbi:ATP-dependent Clp protease ATP-binding subunit ClpB [Catalinimonas alkaloidigena]|uniref:ATP-dependent Clp protease ATP-binding subunit n=1 Tax=Catalinimonas alkaloidigena TaxID=1075417 RepID=UPI002404D8B6|nr:ATP-dependent Clp protease ATP-binding subunit [Catalinimonas alkaloidigena]MDF9798791.1 ATP-dependent Clp protease ATP-binding subunit ClpB [Catalinimonas alkaloidigena]
MTTTLNLSDQTKHAIQIAQSLAKEYQNAQFTPGHLLLALLHKDVGLRDLLNSIGQDIPYLQEWAEVRIENLSKNTQIPEEPLGDTKVTASIEEADLIRLKLNEEEITPFTLLSALCKPNVAFSKDQLKTFPLKQDDLLATVIQEDAIQQAVGSASNGTSGKKSAKSQALYKYCVDKTSLAKEDKIDPIIGRDRETRMMIEILGRRTKPNVLIIGEPGVGKTALVDGFALSIIQEKVPMHLGAALVFELDLGSLVAGASYKGEVEDRLKNIIKEVKTFDKAILFIDEIHLLLDSSGPVGAGAANLLKPELARGEITVIGATTNDEYRKFIEKEEAFNRRFEVLRVEEPDEEAATRMIKTLIPLYEGHHTISVSESTPSEAVVLAKRYVKDRRLPDSAIDLLDRTMAAIRMADETSENELKTLKEELKSFREDEEKLLSLPDLRWFHRQLNDKISPILLGQIVEEEKTHEKASADEFADYLDKTIDFLLTLTEKKRGAVEKEDIAAVVAYKTGIPIGKIQTQEREKLLNMEEHLKKRVVGQDHAIKVISDAILESRSGLTRAGQPIGSFFFLGPTGTGKTELAKSLADFLFNDENMLIRFDMSEFKEAHSAAVLLGAPAGYVGYEEGGILVNKIREKPYSVVLFDEIEKAHASVFDIFLQIMDEGKLHDRLGKEGDFSNAVVLFTSNIGSRHIIDEVEKGNLPTSNEMMDIMSGSFRPEFLARVTEIIPFSPILEKNVVKIFEIHLKKLLKQLEAQGITLEISDEAKQQLALSGYTPEYGARPLTGVIRNQLRRPISRMIIAEKVKKGSVIKLSLDDKKELKWEY